MSDCNATLTTALTEPCDCDPPHNLRTARLWVRVDGGEVTGHITLGRLTCMTPRGSHQTYEFAGETYEMHQAMETRSGGLWGDDWPGAKPHEGPPLVTTSEIEAAMNAYSYSSMFKAHTTPERDRLRSALEAAARVRQENNR